MGAVTPAPPEVRQARRARSGERRTAPLSAWLLAGGAVVVAALLTLAIPAEVRLLRGLPSRVAIVALVMIVAGLAVAGPRAAPFGVAALTLAATAALAVEGGPVGLAAIVIGTLGWLCLELASSSIESRGRVQRAPATVARRIGDAATVTGGGAVVGLLALTVVTGDGPGSVELQVLGVLAAVALVAVVAGLARAAIRR